MKKTNYLSLIALLMAFFLVNPLVAQDKKEEAKKDDKKETSDKESKDKKKKSKIKPYEDIITEEAVTDSGLFIVHKVADKYYFELTPAVMEKEILVVSRVSGFVKGLSFGGAGQKTRPQQVIRWQKKEDKILLRSVSYNSVASHDKPIYKSVRNNNFEPIIAAYDIKTFGGDSTTYVIEVNSLFTTDVPMIGALSSFQKKNFGVGGLDSKRSMIDYMKAFPKNVEVRHIMTYKGGSKLPDNRLTGTLSVEMNQSFIELPEVPMQPRYYDARAAYFSIQQTNYGLDEHKAARQRFITKWRLEPKDMEAFKRGELVEPKEQIVYYIDPGTPEEWRPYLKQGVNDWQSAFEKAGFKNAIIAKDPPTKEEDPDWSPEDVRYSVIRYITTDIQNAQGPHVHDPRTGQILESDIMWYHNVMNLLRNWYFVQTAAVNPDAQSYKFKTEVMGELIRFVAAHEVGHTLGLPHNMGSSAAFPVDSLRSPTFTATHGTAPSIMDYARFNYIAQPEDGVTNFYPGIGEYDNWSIIYGYRPIPEANSAEEERPILNEWIKERADNPLYRFSSGSGTDPSAQTEDLGDNSMKASQLGLKNLKRIVPNLRDWATEDGEDYQELDELYNQVLGQFRRYTGHVTTNVGGVFQKWKTSDEDGVVFTPVSKARQKEAVNFLLNEVFKTPTWLIDKEILRRIENNGMVDRLWRFQGAALNRLFNADRLIRLIEGEALNGSSAYTIMNLFDDTRRGIFSELSAGVQPDAYRRNLQRAYIDRMEALMKIEDNKYDHTDIKAVARGTLRNLLKTVTAAQKKFKSGMGKIYVDDLRARIDGILRNKE